MRSSKNGNDHRGVADVLWRLHDLGSERLLTVDSQEYRTPSVFREFAQAAAKRFPAGVPPLAVLARAAYFNLVFSRR
jgi:hypothetical protein